MVKPNIICLTPVKNEAWILERFLKCASLWADHIIIADQSSSDSSREIAQKFSKVSLINNPNNELNQGIHQQLLIDAARKFPGPRILVALDADEMLTSNFLESPEWKTIVQSPPGTIIELQWVNILPDFLSYWWPVKQDFHYPVIFIDDNSEYKGNSIHCSRIPEPDFAPRIRLKDIKLLHYSYTDWDRAKSKQRWYQCWEKINQPSRNSVWLFRFYCSMSSFPQDEIFPFQPHWIQYYEQQGIDMTSTYKAGIYWRDREILKWMSEYGARKFKDIYIWDVDWEKLSLKILDKDHKNFSDPRSWLDKTIHKWLQLTQPIKDKFAIKLIDHLLKIVGY